MTRKITAARVLGIAVALVMCDATAQAAQHWQEGCAFQGTVARVKGFKHCEVAHNFDRTSVDTKSGNTQPTNR